ncbi:F-box domain-containing protein [Favolaschia claudopus]|uniref:F-box domain-containing protein n=1 Tax=Favolaschia claudopus TaxID=2862362 RepID=A0AAW0EHU2_9AGAR
MTKSNLSTSYPSLTTPFSMVALSLDIYVSILEQIPAHRVDHDGVSTLVSCLQTSTQLREAALGGTLWQPHYAARYLYSDKESEAHRKIIHNSNWRLMYIERRRQDKVALQLLRDILRREGRYKLAATLVSMSLDVWDALDIQRSSPVPAQFSGSPSATVAPFALTLRYWAEAILDTISRRFAILQWSCLRGEKEQPVSFVDAFASLSCFFGIPPGEVQAQLLTLGNNCREYLIKHECRLDSTEGSDLPDICIKICSFMHEQGFGAVEPTRFYDISNHFPHLYLTTHKRSIPLSLVHVFVFLSRHCCASLYTSPVEFPARVLAHVSSPPGSDDFLVDVYASNSKAILSLRSDVPVMLTRLGISPDNFNQYISPCGAAPMLLRAARNILASFRNDASRSTAQSAIYAAVCIHLLLTGDHDGQFIAHMLSHVDLDPLYCSTFLADMQPLLPHGRQRLAYFCKAALESEEQQAAIVHSRAGEASVAHYVGMIFEHKAYQYIGCIFGWDRTCSATEEWQTNMNVQRLDRGPDQPFYHVLSLDGGQRYVAEDNVIPIALTQELAHRFYKEVPLIARYFSDAYTHPESCRGRWKLSPELELAYPDDTHYSTIFDEYMV